MASDIVSEPANLTASDIDDEQSTGLLEPSWSWERPNDYVATGRGESSLKKIANRPGNRRLFAVHTSEEHVIADIARSTPAGGFAKRLFDIAVAGTALVLLSPMLMAVALLIYVKMGSPVIFAHRRLGFGGRPFRCLKFRTMVENADIALKLHLANDPEAAREWHLTQKLRRDPRITTLGKMLRRSSIDELPQLVSVLRGDMSCVGPRPIVDAEIVRYGDYWAEYTRARPGITGAWQVSGRNRLNYERRVALDRYYVRRWSMWRDLGILIRTMPAVLRTDETA